MGFWKERLRHICVRKRAGVVPCDNTTKEGTAESESAYRGFESVSRQYRQTLFRPARPRPTPPILTTYDDRVPSRRRTRIHRVPPHNASHRPLRVYHR